MSFEREGHMDVGDDSIVHIVGHFPILLSSAISASINQGLVPALQILSRLSLSLLLTPIYLVARPTVAILAFTLRALLVLFSPAIEATRLLWHVGVTVPLGLLARFVPFYNFFATAIIVGLLTGLILHQLSSMTSSILGLQQQRSSTTDLRYALKAEKFKSRPTIITTATSATSYAQDRSDPPLLLPSPRRENGNGITAKILHSHLQHPSAKYRRVPSAAPNGLLSEVDLKRWDNGW